MSDPGRGTSRGVSRGRGQKPAERPPGPTPTTSKQAPPPAQPVPTPQGAWARGKSVTRPGPAQQPPSQRPPIKEPQSSGAPAGGDVARSGVGVGGDASSLGRGAVRGRRVIISGEVLNTRPQNLTTKKGITGTTVELTTNYFKLLSLPDWCLYQYRVDFSPEEDRGIVRKGLLRLHKEKLGAYLFDGSVMYTVNRLTESMNDVIEYFSERTSDNAKIRISIKLVGDIVRGDHNYLQFFNILMRKCLGALNLQLVGRNFFDAGAKVEVREHRFELWPGYITSIRQHEKDILMCSEITHKVMRQENLLDILEDCYNRSPDQYQDLFKKEVIGLVILTDYNNKTYRIDDVDFSAKPQSTFPLKSGDKISYQDYYQKKYNIRIKNGTQPLLITRTKPKDRRAGQEEIIYLVPELCRATGLTDSMRANFRLMAEMAKFTRVSPQTRIDKLLRFNERLRSEPKVTTEFDEWRLKLDRNLVKLSGRVLPQEKVIFGGNAPVLAGTEADWTRSLRNVRLSLVKELSEWVVICMDRSKRETQNFIDSLRKAGGGLGLKIQEPRYIEINSDRSQIYTNAIETVMSKSNPELILCVVPNNRADRYSAIKKKCLVDRPVPTQVILGRTLGNKGLMSVATKVAIQLNCKIGGAAWGMDMPLSNSMIVGFDVSHDTNFKDRDYGAMVASLDRGLTRYFSAVSSHSNGEELSNHFAANLLKAIDCYRKINGCLPKTIMIYRDGVGEGQIPYVFEHEVMNLRRKLEELYGDPSLVRMAFILVTKRINTRFFAGKENPLPGTVVDDVVTNPVKYDFFIVSQFVRQGTVSPTAYSVISDSLGLSPDQIQRITFKLTHMYFNWTGTVRVPAPCQYAHKLAFLVGQCLHQPPSTEMQDLLYFL